MWFFDRIKSKRVSTFLMVTVILFSMVLAGNASVNENYSSGSLLASSNGFEMGYIIYRSVENQDTSVATLETDFGGVAPFHPFFTQRLTLNDKSFYLSNSIAGFEIFNDVNNNGYIDSVDEINFFVMLNATQNFDFSEITKTVASDMTTYQWTSHYYEIDGFPMEPTGSLKVNQNSDQEKILIPSFNITYTLTETTNNSRLSVKYDIGAFDAYTFQFDNNYQEVRTGTIDLSGLSLSLVYTSVIRSTEDVQKVTYSNGDTITDIKFVSNSNVVFESNVDEIYTLGNTEKAIQVKTVIADPQTILPEQQNYWSLTHDYLDTINKWTGELGNFTAVPDDTVPVKEIFNYRIAYPEWDGQEIHHDPVYQANKVLSSIDTSGSSSSQTTISSSNTSSIPISPGFSYITGAIGLMAVGLAVTINRKKKI